MNKIKLQLNILISFIFVISMSATSEIKAMEDYSGGAPHYAKLKHNLPNILKRVEDGEANISSLDGKDIVIVLGRTQVGKSTTINSLLGAELCELENGNIVPNPSKMELDEFAQIGGDGLSCTTLPGLYTAPEHQFAFLDTRGFYDVRMDPEGDIAASILTEMAVKRANSVRIMLIEDFKNLERGVVSFRELGSTLSKIVVGQKVPTLFLFNRYTPPKNQAKNFYQRSEEQQEKIIEDSIHRSINNLLIGEEKVASGVAKNVANRLGKVFDGILSLFSPDNSSLDEAISSDQEFKKALTEIGYTGFLKYNHELGNIGYIDPLSSRSREYALVALEKLNPVDPKSLIFNGYNSARVEFDEAFAQGVSPLLLLMKAKEQVSKYSLTLLEEWAEEADICLNYHGAVLENIGHILPDEIETMELAYATKAEDVEIQKGNLKRNLEDLKNKKSLLKKDIYKLLSGDPILYWTDIWKKECGFFAGWWRNYECYYPEPTNFTKWKDSLEPNTTRSKIKRSDTPYLHVCYTSSVGSDCEGKMKVYVAPGDDPSTAELVKVKRTEIDGLKTSITNVNKSLHNLSIEAANDLKSKVSSKVRIFQEQVDHLRRAIKLRKEVDELYETQREKIKLCVSIADKLGSTKPVVEDLRNFYHQFPDILSREKQKFTKLEDEIFGNPLLDPVQLLCTGLHGYSYERHKIAEYLRQKGACPHCREKTSKFIPVGTLVIEVSEIIDDIFNNTLSAEKILADLQIKRF